MRRRKFIGNSLLAGTSILGVQGYASGRSSNQNREKKTFQHQYAPHDGMFRNLGGNDFLDQIRFMHDQGFTALEDNGLMGRSPEMQEKIGALLDKLGMTMGVFVLDKGGNHVNSFTAGKKEHTDVFLTGCRKALETAKRVNAQWTTVVPGNYERSLPLDRQHANVIDTLRRGVEILEPHGLVMVLEPLSDTPDLYLRYADQAYMLCRAVNSPSCKILFDMYHTQRNEGDLINRIARCWDETVYYQVGDNPGRNEPGTGEVNYKNIFKFLYDKGYKGVIGMEHGNSQGGKEGEQAVIEAYKKADDF